MGGRGKGAGVSCQASCASPWSPPTLSLPFKVPDVLDFVTFPVLFFFSPLETQGLVFEEKVNKEELAWRYVVGVTLFSEH